MALKAQVERVAIQATVGMRMAIQATVGMRMAIQATVGMRVAIQATLEIKREVSKRDLRGNGLV